MQILNDELLDDIFNQEITVYEDIKGFKIYVKFDGEDFVMKPDLNAEIVNIIEDESMESFYGKAFNYFNQLDQRIKSLLPKKWWFIFEYFPAKLDTYPYNRLPKNNLVLTSIYKNGKIEYTVEEVEEYARLMDVQCLPFVFKGRLSEKAIEAIKYFLNTSEDDLEYVFGERSFAYFFYKVLNPQIMHSFLMDNDFNKNIEKFVLSINGKHDKFEILNPLYKKISDENLTEYNEVYSLILMSALNFFQTVDFKSLKLKGEKRIDVYNYIICKIFNIYISEVKEDIKEFNFTIPEFFNKDKFRINKEIILNKLTKEYIEEDIKLDYLFKCIYFSFQTEIDEPFGIFTEGGIVLFNNFVKFIQKMIDEFFNKKSEEEFMKRGLVNFDTFFDIKYDTDGDNKVYPNTNLKDEFNGGNKKKKKKGIGYDKEDLGEETKKTT